MPFAPDDRQARQLRYNARRDYVRSIVDAIEVNDKAIGIIGNKDVLQAVIIFEPWNPEMVWGSQSASPAPHSAISGLVMDSLQAIDRRRDALVARLQVQGKELRVLSRLMQIAAMEP
jgi:hypothetical protein